MVEENPTEKEELKPEKTETERLRENLDKLKEANDEVEKELLRKEELKARMQLGGNTSAGQKPVKEDPALKMAEEIAGALV